MKQTKEQLIEEITKLRQSHAEWVTGDERKRKEFATAFNWYVTNDPLGYFNQKPIPSTPSWEQIFVNIGNLLAKQEFIDYEDAITEIQSKIESLEKLINQYINEKETK